MLCIEWLRVNLWGVRQDPFFCFSIDSVPTYLDWMLDALYASHPNIIRARPAMWFESRMWGTHAWPVDVSLLSGPPWGKITFLLTQSWRWRQTENTYIQYINKPEFYVRFWGGIRPSFTVNSSIACKDWLGADAAVCIISLFIITKLGDLCGTEGTSNFTHF